MKIPNSCSKDRWNWIRPGIIIHFWWSVHVSYLYLCYLSVHVGKRMLTREWWYLLLVFLSNHFPLFKIELHSMQLYNSEKWCFHYWKCGAAILLHACLFTIDNLGITRSFIPFFFGISDCRQLCEEYRCKSRPTSTTRWSTKEGEMLSVIGHTGVTCTKLWNSGK